MSNVTRRELLKWSAAVAGSAVLARAGFGADAPPAKKVLFFTKSSGFQHSVIDRHGKDEPAYAEAILTDLGKRHGFDVTCSKDGGLFTAEKLAAFDAVAFYTTGDLTTAGTDKQPPMPADGKQALLDFVAGGKGFVGIHSATDTFHSHGTEIDPYIAMIGGEFVAHGSQQMGTVAVTDGKFPGAPDGKGFRLTEEWYAMTHFAPDLHAILTLDTRGMKGAMYQRPPFPSTWARPHGKGRVFYTAMGHREDVWKEDRFTALLLGGLGWATGTGEVDVTPNVGK